MRVFSRSCGLCLALVMLVFVVRSAAQPVPTPKLGKKANQVLKQAQGTAKKTLAELEKLGLDKPPKPTLSKARKSAGKLVSTFKQRGSIRLSVQDQKALEAMYADLEARASAEVKAEVETVRAEAKKRGWKFKVGVTSVSGIDPQLLVGWLGPPPRRSEVETRRRARREQKAPPNLYQRTRLARAEPPDDLAPRSADPDGMDAASRSNPVVAPLAPADPKSNAKVRYTSSQFPSVTATAFSWRDRLTPVKSQAACGSCWAFAVVGAVEGSDALFNGRQLDLSEQHAVNCAPLLSGSKSNCEGYATPYFADYLMTNKLPLEAAAPYKSTLTKPVSEKCSATTGLTYGLNNWGWATKDPLRPGTSEIKEALITHGPIVARMHAGNRTFTSYQGGDVLVEVNPKGSADHAIVIVGWDDSLGAWHVRNSWGPGWGEAGYFWVKYGTNHIGENAFWLEPYIEPPPPEVMYRDRFVDVENTSAEPVKVFMLIEAGAGNKWTWQPAKPTPTVAPYSFTVAARSKGSLAVNSKQLAGRKVRVWSQSLDGKRVWTDYRDKDYVLAKDAYRAVTRQRHIIVIPTQREPVPTPEQVLQSAHELRETEKFADARAAFSRFISLFPDDSRVHEARYWIGATFSDEEKHSDAALAFHEMLVAIPDDHPFVAFGYYGMGVAMLSLGYCGHATRLLEVVVYAELSIDKEWIDMANDWLTEMEKDDGKLCADWD